jgi:hypothetical protein
MRKLAWNEDRRCDEEKNCYLLHTDSLAESSNTGLGTAPLSCRNDCPAMIRSLRFPVFYWIGGSDAVAVAVRLERITAVWSA